VYLFGHMLVLLLLRDLLQSYCVIFYSLFGTHCVEEINQLIYISFLLLQKNKLFFIKILPDEFVLYMNIKTIKNFEGYLRSKDQKL
jgi:hypothetical protein